MSKKVEGRGKIRRRTKTLKREGNNLGRGDPGEIRSSGDREERARCAGQRDLKERSWNQLIFTTGRKKSMIDHVRRNEGSLHGRGEKR